MSPFLIGQHHIFMISNNLFPFFKYAEPFKPVYYFVVWYYFYSKINPLNIIIIAFK